jgi:DNA polymerase-3 subunit delta
MPFLAAQRLVILTGVSARYPQAGGQKKFIEFLNQVPGSAILALVEPEALKETHWLVKWARSGGEDIKAESFMLPRKREMPDWIIKETQKQGGKIDREAAARLAEMVGEETRVASLEITKLLTYINYKRAVDLADVEAVSVVTAQADVFAMVDALGGGNGREATRLLHQLLQDEDVFQIFGMVTRQFRLLLQTREVLDEGGNTQKVIEALHVAPFVAEKLTGQARRFTLPALENIYRRLLALDEAAKTGEMPLETGLEMFVADLTKKS